MEPNVETGEMTERAEIGLIGLGVIGGNLAGNLADNGYRVAAFDAFDQVRAAFAAAAAGVAAVTVHPTRAALVADLAPARAVLLSIKAGPPVDDEIAALAPLLAPGDIIIDAGNSQFRDTDRRADRLAAGGLGFLGIGVSGGAAGARRGASIMAGGTNQAYADLAAMFGAVAAKVDGKPCTAYFGPGGAGHLVKMVHNGIEYADMQLIAEAYYLMDRLLGLDQPAMAKIVAGWNDGALRSYLMAATADILTRTDDDTGRPLLDVIEDRAGHKGTGVWAATTALELGVPAPTIAAAVAARAASALQDERRAAEGRLAGAGGRIADPPKDFVEDLRDALICARYTAYAQGFAILAAAGRDRRSDLNLAQVSAVWRGGAIIQADCLGQIEAAFGRDPNLANLMVDPAIAEILIGAEAGLRRVVAAAANHGAPAPALGSALAYYDAYRSGRLWANMIQAQRDYFGAHGFERIDRPGTFHGPWADGSGPW